MNFIRLAFSRLRALLRPSRIEQDMEKEMRLHLDLLIEDRERSGMSRAEAERAGRRQFGNVLGIKERGRDVRGAGLLGDILQDVRYAARMLYRNPIFTAVVGLSLAIGIGANTALFSLMDAKFLRKLPVREPDQLASFEWVSNGWSPEVRGGGVVGGRDFKRSAQFSRFALDQFSAASTTLSDVLAVGMTFEASAGIDGAPERVFAQLVSGNYFTALGVPAVAGRPFTSDDDQASGEPVAVISHRFWQRRFAENPSAVGKKVFLNGMLVTIIGVAPREFRGTSTGGRAPNFIIPLAFAPRFHQWSADAEQSAWWLRIMGRMKPGIAREQVRGELEGVLQGVALQSTRGAAGPGVMRLEVSSASRGFVDFGQNSTMMVIVLCIVFGVLLLIVCLNVANMLLARAAARQYEIGVRLAMGAGRARLVRQLLTESVMLALIGGTMGAVLAFWGKDVFTLLRGLGEDLELRLDLPVLAFTVSVSVLTGILFGLAPTFRATRIDLHSTVKRTRQNSGVSRSLLDKSMLVAEVAISVILLMGAGLFLRTMGNWNRIDAGFNTDNMLVFGVNPGTLQYDDARASSLYEQILGRIQSLPGVLAVTTSDNFWSSYFPAMRIPGEPRFRPVRALSIRPNFFGVMGIPLLAGRGFTPSDTRGSPRVAVIDESVARRYFPGANPLGRRFSLTPGKGEDIEIVGIVKDITIPNPVPEDIRPMIYIPESQNSSGTTWGSSLEIRTAGDPLSLAPAIIKAVGEIEPALPVVDIQSMKQGLDQRLEPIRLASLTWSAFGIVGALLTCIGLYGLMSYSIVRRTQEIGVRMALGAGRYRVLRLVMGQSLGIVTLGLAVGVSASLGLNQIIQFLFFGVRLYDPPTMLAVAVLMMAVTGAAAYIPARRASRVNPTVALRYE